MMRGKKLQSLTFFYFMYFFFAPMGSTRLDFFVLCVQHLPCTVVRHLLVASWKTQCLTQKTLLIEADTAVKLPREPRNVFTS